MSPPGLADAPLRGELADAATTAVAHVFTHFRSNSRLRSATADGHSAGATGEWWPIADIESAGLPTVFAKAATAIRRAA